MTHPNNYWRRKETATSINLVVDDPLLIIDTYITNAISPFLYRVMDKKSKAFKEIQDTEFPFGDPSKTIRIGNNDTKIIAAITNNTDPNVFAKIKSATSAAVINNSVLSTSSVFQDTPSTGLGFENLPAGMCQTAIDFIISTLGSKCCCTGQLFGPGDVPYRPAAPFVFEPELNPNDIPCGWYAAGRVCQCTLTVTIDRLCPGQTGSTTLSDEYFPVYEEEQFINPDDSWDQQFETDEGERFSPEDWWYGQGIPDGGVVVAAEDQKQTLVCDATDPLTRCRYSIIVTKTCRTTVSVRFTPGCREWWNVPGRIPILNDVTDLTTLFNSEIDKTVTLGTL